ncbi:MAG: undecaprenyl-diphosphatase UppP [Thermoplasmatota archaeon]
MDVLHAIILGLLQGITEFGPVSSTAHLTILGHFMGVVSSSDVAEWTAFLAVLQLGPVVATIAFFWRDLVDIVTGFVGAIVARARKTTPTAAMKAHERLGWLIIGGTIPIVILGYAFRKTIESPITKNLWIIAAMLIVLAIILAVAELVGRRERSMEPLGWKDAALVGGMQVLALVPGASRSGSTINGGLFAGLNREAAARYSFLLLLPATLGAATLEVPRALHDFAGSKMVLVAGVLAAAIAGYATIWVLLRYLQRHSTWLFVGWRVALGVILIALLLSGTISAT